MSSCLSNIEEQQAANTKKLTKEQVEAVIKERKTTSSKEIAEVLNVEIAAVIKIMRLLTKADYSRLLEVCPICKRFKTYCHATYDVRKESVLGFDAKVCTDMHEETKVTMVKQLSEPSWVTKPTSGLKANLKS